MPSSAPASSHRLESVPPAVLIVGDEIGKGRFKRVHRGRYKRRDVVILRFSKDGDSNELRILTWLGQKGPNQLVPDVYGICNERDATSVVQEIAAWGALKAVLKDNELSPKVTTSHRLRGSAHIARAMAYLQSVRVVHADLSCRNVLVCRLEVEPASFLLKITDFGLSVLLQEDADYERKKQPQATRWCSPETIAYQKLSHRADVWSYGATIWEMFADGALPWSKREKRGDVAARLRDLAENDGLSEGGTDVSGDFAVPSACPKSAHEVVLQCFTVDEFSRPTFVQLQESFDRVIQDVERNAEEGDVAHNGSTGHETPPGADDERVVRFKALKALLRSSQASEVAAEESRQAIWKEIEDAQAREVYLLDLVRRMQTAIPRADAPGSPETREAHSPPPCSSVRRAARASVPCLVPSIFSAPRAASTSRLSVPRLSVRAPHSPTLSYVPSTEYLVNPSGTLPGTAPGMWSLWSFAGTQLRRQEFVTEAEAWAAFDTESKVSPCMLRDPGGAEAAARNWVASYLRHPSPCASAGAGNPAAVAPGVQLAALGVVSLSVAAAAAVAANSAAVPLVSPARGSSAWRTGLTETLGGSLKSDHGSVSPLRTGRSMSALGARGHINGHQLVDLSCTS